MRFLQMEPATFLVREKGFNPKAFGIQPTRLFSDTHIADQIQRVMIALRPTTDEHNRPIRGLCKVDIREGYQRARLDTRPQGIEAKGLALPRGRHMTPGATPIRPTRLCQRVLQPGAIKCAI